MKIKIDTNHWLISLILVSLSAIFILAAVTPFTLAAKKESKDPEAIVTKGLFSDHSEEGYIRIGNVQIVWGLEDIKYLAKKPLDNRIKTINFPAAFSEIPAVTLGSQQTQSARYTVFITKVTKTAFTIKSTSNNNDAVSWIAIGKWEE